MAPTSVVTSEEGEEAHRVKLRMRVRECECECEGGRECVERVVGGRECVERVGVRGSVWREWV